MHEYFIAIIMGIVEGLTEFLPISSTGHLILAGYALDFTGPKAAAFEIIIQFGAILAVVLIYWSRFIGLIRPQAGRAFGGLRGIYLLFLTCLPASVLGLVAHSTIKQYLWGPKSVALALAVGAVLILILEFRPSKKKASCRSLDELTPKLALGIGLFQCLSLWPGFSRSASTIMGGMFLGASRTMAAEYSFIAAVPILAAASSYEFLKNMDLFSWSELPMLGIGFVVSFISAWVAVRTFIKLLQVFTLRPFAVYRLILAPIVFFLWPS